MKKNYLMALAAAAGLLSASALWAGGGEACRFEPKAKMEKRADRLAKKLDLTDEQKAKVKDVFAAKSQKMEEVHKQMMELHQNSKNEIVAILTPEQKEKFEKMKEGKMRGKGGKHGKGKHACCGDK